MTAPDLPLHRLRRFDRKHPPRGIGKIKTGGGNTRIFGCTGCGWMVIADMKAGARAFAGHRRDLEEQTVRAGRVDEVWDTEMLG